MARQALALCAAVCVALTSGVADAKHKKHHATHKEKRSSKKSKSRSKKKHDRRDGYEITVRRPNMPPGWSWPPSRAMKAEGDACLAKLDELGVKYEKGPKTKKIVTPIVVPDMTFAGVKVDSWWRKGPYVMDCHLALGLETYGKGLYALGVREMKFSSIYRYDVVHVFGQTKHSLSRHALGLAMDIHSFTDAAGNEAVVKDDYPKGNELLLDIEKYLDDSGGFRTVLTPRIDPISHSDHFHVEVKVEYPTGTRRPNT